MVSHFPYVLWGHHHEPSATHIIRAIVPGSRQPWLGCGLDQDERIRGGGGVHNHGQWLVNGFNKIFLFLACEQI